MIANVFWRGRAAKLFGWLGVLALLVGLPSMLASTRANATTYYHLTFFLNNSNVPAGIGLLADGVGNMQFAASPVFTIDLTASQLNVVVPNPTGHIGGHASPFALLGVSGTLFGWVDGEAQIPANERVIGIYSRGTFPYDVNNPVFDRTFVFSFNYFDPNLGSNGQQVFAGDFEGYITATTPIPGALPLFTTGLGALGLLGWRRKRKIAALAA